jgi:hypothetical protein
MITKTVTLSDQSACQQSIGQVAMSSIEREEPVEDINFGSDWEQPASTIWRTGGLVRDFEHFNFLHLEPRRTCERNRPIQSGVFGVTAAKGPSLTEGVCVAIIGNTNVPKVWTVEEITIDCHVLLFGLQRKSPRRDVGRILQREKETLQTRVGSAAIVKPFKVVPLA